MNSPLKLFGGHFSMLALAGGLALSAEPSLATVYNFDFTGFTPSPVYDSVTLSYDVSGTTGGIACKVYDGLNASGSTLNGCASTTNFLFSYADADVVDGVFSINLSTLGDFTTGVPSAFGVRGGMNTPVLVGVVPRTVPEPATMFLLALGAVVIAVSRRGV